MEVCQKKLMNYLAFIHSKITFALRLRNYVVKHRQAV